MGLKGAWECFTGCLTSLVAALNITLYTVSFLLHLSIVLTHSSDPYKPANVEEYRPVKGALSDMHSYLAGQLSSRSRWYDIWYWCSDQV